MEKKYDQKFTFAYKNGNLDFSYEQDGKYAEGKMNKSFDFGERLGRNEIEADSNWAHDPVSRHLLTEDNQEPMKNPSVRGDSLVEVLRKAPYFDELNEVMETPFEEVSTGISETDTEPVQEAVQPVSSIPVMELPVVPEPAPVVASEAVTSVPVVDVLVDANKTDLPTVQVRMPEELPQIVSVDATTIGESVDPKSPHPQVVVELKDASVAVPEDATLYVVKTPDGSSDLVVAVPPAVSDVAGVNVVQAVQKAVNTWEAAPALPDLSVTSPDAPISVVPQLVQMHLDNGTVVLRNVSENIPADHHMLPVETPPDMPNIVAVIDDTTKAEFEKFNLDPAKELAKFLATTKTEIATSTEVHEKDVFDKFGKECDGHECKKSRWGKTQ